MARDSRCDFDNGEESPMKVAFLATAVLAVVIARSIPATAHHSNPRYFDMAKVITLDGVVLRVRWINPHIILYLQSKNEKGEQETWVIHGSSPSNAVRQV